LLNQWKTQPPPWRDSLYRAPEDYADEAGWELGDDGHRRDLYFHTCLELLEGPAGSPEGFHAIADSPDSCPWCAQPLTYLFTLQPARLGLEGMFAQGDQVQVTTCEVCTAFGTVFGKYDGSGHGRWHPLNTRPKYLPDDSETWDRMLRNSLQVANARSPLAAASQFLPVTFSQLGGHPTWVQDAGYPQCPECSNTMMFLAQVARDEIDKHAEGTYYAFVCSQCRTTATAYQQT